MRRTHTVCAALAMGCLPPQFALARYGLNQPELVAPVRPGEQVPAMAPSNAPPPPGGAVRMDPAPRILAPQPSDATPPVEYLHEPAAACDFSRSCDECTTYSYGGWTYCNCCLGEAWTLKSALTPCCDNMNYGGWVSLGYHTNFERLSDENTQGRSYNDRPDEINLHQAWFYVERVANADSCGADWGYRFDAMYGLDAQKTQAFGNPRADVRGQGRWDASFDHGVYGWALPQAYGEYAQGDWRVKAGHFFTLVGYEIAQAPANFFYSHSLTFFNSEPLTHTGVLAAYEASDDLTIHLGWTLGWDTGFDQFEDGNSLHAGFASQLSDDVRYTYMCTAGDFGWRGDGYSHSSVLILDVSDRLSYVLQNDYLNVTTPADFDNEDVGINQYLFYTLNDCWKLGARIEWWKSNNPTGEAASYYELTGGINYRPHANLVIRPEVRYDWTPSNEAYDSEFGVSYNQFVFGIDAVWTY